MRITESIISRGTQQYISNNAEKVYRCQETISTGKRINRASDDPAAMTQILAYRKTISSIDQYSRNIGNAQSELNLAESNLAHVGELMTRAKELLLAQVGDTASADTRKIAAAEMKQIRDEIMQVANTKVGNRYLFGGTQTSTPPYDAASDSPEYQGNDESIQTMIAPGVTMTTNANGKSAFTRDVDTVTLLSDMIKALDANDTRSINEHLNSVDQAMNQAVDARADVGAKLNRLETTSSQWDTIKLNLTQNMSNVEDADMSEAIAQLNGWQTAYQASLAVSAKVFQQSLLDFLQ